jgi:hypothetical protein
MIAGCPARSPPFRSSLLRRPISSCRNDSALRDSRELQVQVFTLPSSRGPLPSFYGFACGPCSVSAALLKSSCPFRSLSPPAPEGSPGTRRTFTYCP